CKAPDILLAMQPVGVNMQRFFALMEKYPDSLFSALVDNMDTLRAFSEKVKSQGRTVSLWMDINAGMDRTGITPHKHAIDLYRRIDTDPSVEACGLHIYDGHIRNTDVAERKQICDRAFTSVIDLKNKLEAKGISVKGIVAGGSPTFPFHAKREGVQASPGTTLLWDAGYGGLFPEMEFLPAAVLMTRIISKPAKNIICLDLGHKHLASEMPFPRVKFLGLGDINQEGQSEEHFVLGVENSENFAVGDVLYAIPMHICPTVAKYESLQVVSEGRIIDEWEVVARNQRINV
ncbi:MAG: alanine racemase, partial [Pricia sp.]